MTLFRKPKSAHTTIVMQILRWLRDTFKLNYGWVLVIFGIPAPQTCHRCQQRPGTLRIHPISSAAVEPAAKDTSDDWWLCGDCAEALRPDDPSLS